MLGHELTKINFVKLILTKTEFKVN